MSRRWEVWALYETPVLAARGDVATPTEVEWGVIYEVDRDSVIYEPQESEAHARALVAHSPTDTGLVQRTVSAWREVTDRA